MLEKESCMPCGAVRNHIGQIHRAQIVVVHIQGLRAAHVVVVGAVEVEKVVVVAMEKVLCSHEAPRLARPSWVHVLP